MTTSKRATLTVRTICLSMGLAIISMTPNLAAQDTRLRVTVENLSPTQGTFQTPVWVGFHDGTFDIYDRGVAAGALLPMDALERLAEDGNTGVIADVFLQGGADRVEGTLVGPMGPIAPGDLASGSFLLDSRSQSHRYFSYATMLIPSNDAFLANGNPLAIPIFDERGDVIAPDTFDLGTMVLDAGTEVNDEIPMNTAFFGQTEPDTGVDEGGVVDIHPGFLPLGSGGILDDFRFGEGNFRQEGYPALKLRFESAPAVTEFRVHLAAASGDFEVPPVKTPAFGVGFVTLNDSGTAINFFFRFFGLENVVAAHFHLGAIGINGPVVASLIEPLAPGGGSFNTLRGSFDASSLQGPFQAHPLDAFADAMNRGDIYINVHTDDGQGEQNTGPGDYASGEVRGQLIRF